MGKVGLIQVVKRSPLGDYMMGERLMRPLLKCCLCDKSMFICTSTSIGENI